MQKSLDAMLAKQYFPDEGQQRKLSEILHANRDCMPMLLAKVWAYGVICGKREERARTKARRG